MGQDLWFSSFIFHRTTEYETGVPTAKTWADPGFVEPKYYKIGGSLFKRKKITNAINLKLLLLKYLTLAVFTKPCDHVNTLLNPLRFSLRAQGEACVSKEPWSLNFVSVIVNSSLDGTPTSQNGVVNHKQNNLSEESQGGDPGLLLLSSFSILQRLSFF